MENDRDIKPQLSMELERPPLDFSSLLEAPVMIYNANPFVKRRTTPNPPINPSEAQTVEKAVELKVKRLKNGCYEYKNVQSGQRTRIGGKHLMSLTNQLHDLVDTSEDEEDDDREKAILDSLLKDAISTKRKAQETLPNRTELSHNVLRPTGITNTPHLLRRDESEGETPSPFTLHNKARENENSHPLGNNDPQQSEDPFLACYSNLMILNKEVVQKKNGQRGLMGNVEKIRVEMESLEDGYKWRKYGRKEVKGNVYPRNYFKCTFPNCMCRKQVEQNPSNPRMLIATYEGRHIHPPPFISQQQPFRHPRR